MQTARRLYLYLVSGATLGVLAVGLTMLLAVVFAQLGLTPTGTPIFGTEAGGQRQQLSVAVALIGVGLPVWLIHWYLVERGARPGGRGGEPDRTSTVRALYFTIVLAVLLYLGALAATDLLRAVVLQLTGGVSTTFAQADPAGSLAALLVTGAAWLYHATLRRRDMRAGPLASAAAWLPRAYLYLAAFVGLLVLLLAIGDLAKIATDSLFPTATLSGGDAEFRRQELGSAVGRAIVAAAVWLGHFGYARRLLADHGWRGVAERVARLRIGYFVATIAAAALFAILRLTDAARPLIAAALGVPDGGPSPLATATASLLAALPFIVAWWLHVRWLKSEAAEAGDSSRMALALRLDRHAVALVGLAFGAIGLGWLIGLLVDVLLGGDRTLLDNGVWRQELSQFVPFALLGSALWLWKWFAIELARARNAATEAGSTVRRAYLLAILAGSLAALLSSLALILYRFVAAVLGVSIPGNVVSELSTPLGALIVAVAVGVYHGLAIRRDQALRAHAAAAVELGAGEPAGEAARAQLGLVLSGPAEGDLEAALDGMRRGLPGGYELRIGPE